MKSDLAARVAELEQLNTNQMAKIRVLDELLAAAEERLSPRLFFVLATDANAEVTYYLVRADSDEQARAYLAETDDVAVDVTELFLEPAGVRFKLALAGRRLHEVDRSLLAAADAMRHHLHTVGHEPNEKLADGEHACALCTAAEAYDVARRRIR